MTTTRADLTLAGSAVTADDALGYLTGYAHQHVATANIYDYAGINADPHAHDGVSMADIARLVIINAQLRADDVPALLRPRPDALWEAVPHDLDFRDLPDDPREHDGYKGLTRLYESFTAGTGIKQAKATKLLHLKRPLLVPIVDSIMTEHYRPAAETTARGFGEALPQFWATIWREARANEPVLRGVVEELRAQGVAQERVARLPLLRLHDILVWSHFGKQTVGI